MICFADICRNRGKLEGLILQRHEFLLFNGNELFAF